jgi:predicted aspartyl protease
MIDTGFAGFFVFEEPVGNVVICRNHENAVIKSIAFAIAFDDVVEYVLKL